MRARGAGGGWGFVFVFDGPCLEQEGGEAAELVGVRCAVDEAEEDLKGPLVGVEDGGVVFGDRCGHVWPPWWMYD